MLSKTLRTLTSLGLNKVNKFAMNHIKNMDEENLKFQLEELVRKPSLVQTNRVYKPTYTIEFNREGQVLLYSANPIKNQTIYFKYPYVMYESLCPLFILNYVLNPFEMVWYWPSFFFWISTAMVIPRIWYFSDFIYTPQKIFLLRGGRVLKVESQTISNRKYIYWFETFQCKPLTQDKLRFDDRDNADFLTEQGQLKYDLNIELEDCLIYGMNVNDQQLYFKTYGTVHHPELFEAAMKGYNIDTNDFVINTADNIRYREANYDQ